MLTAGEVFTFHDDDFDFPPQSPSAFLERNRCAVPPGPPPITTTVPPSRKGPRFWLEGFINLLPNVMLPRSRPDQDGRLNNFQNMLRYDASPVNIPQRMKVWIRFWGGRRSSLRIACIQAFLKRLRMADERPQVKEQLSIKIIPGDVLASRLVSNRKIMSGNAPPDSVFSCGPGGQKCRSNAVFIEPGNGSIAYGYKAIRKQSFCWRDSHSRRTAA